MSNSLVLKPKVSEKTYSLSQTNRTYVFEVPADCNKLTVKAAVQAQYKVTVTNVNIANQKGKVKQSYRRRLRPIEGKRKDTKLAYVTLKDGDSMPIFAAIETTEQPEPKRTKKETK